MIRVTIEHLMDEGPRKVTLDEAFLEALELSDSCAAEIEVMESELLSMIKKHPSLLQNITQEFKLSVLRAWDYEVVL